VAQQKLSDTKFEALDRAVVKAEAATEKRFEGVNEFRQQLGDQQRTFIPRSEVLVIQVGLNEKIVQLTKPVDEVKATQAGTVSARQGARDGYGWAVGLVGLVVGVLGLLGAPLALLRGGGA